MIDTIKLLLDKRMFMITDTSLFQKEKMNAARGYFTLVQNPTSGELKRGLYRPRLTLTKRHNCSGRFEPTLTIELSLPKLVFGNNFDELTDAHFPQVVDLLQEQLRTMGVLLFTTLLCSAPVSAVHYSKNIPLTDGSTPHYLIGKMREANISLALDVNQTDYRNEGHSYKWHSNSYEVAFYDKIKDLEMAQKSDKRAIEEDSSVQLALFDSLRRQQRLEVLRMEVRINKRVKMKSLFKKLGIAEDLTFRGLFSQDIAQKVLLYYLDELERQRPQLLDYHSSSPKALLAEIVMKNPKLGVLRTLQAFGIKQALEVFTPRELRAMFSKNSQRSWYRLMTGAKKVNVPTVISPFKVIREHLKKFEPLRLADFEDQMLNHDKEK